MSGKARVSRVRASRTRGRWCRNPRDRPKFVPNTKTRRTSLSSLSASALTSILASGERARASGTGKANLGVSNGFGRWRRRFSKLAHKRKVHDQISSNFWAHGVAMPRPRERRGRGGRGASQRPVEDYPDEDDDEDTKPPFVDLYAALELDKSASSASIKKSYRTLALRWHPDKNAGYADAQVKFQAIGKAYEILGDPRKKSYYDTTGDVEDIDVTADEFVNTFVEMMDEMLGDSSIGEMLEGLDSRSMSNMPPFPFPEVLFPENTFPAGMKFAKDFHVPPAVSELLENEGPEALQDLVRKARLENKKGPGRKSSSQFDDDDDDYSDSGSDEWESASDFDEEEAAGNTRDAVPRGGRAGPNASSPRGTGSKLENISLDDENDSEMDEDELLEMMRSMPPEMFQQFLREDAANGGGGATAEEAVKLLELLQKGGEGGMGETFGQILGGSDVPPEIERLLSGFGGRKNNSKNDSADFGQRDDADPVSSGGNSGGRGGKIHFDQRARPRNGGKSAFRRGKKGGPGPDFVHKKESGSGDGGFGPTENGDLRFDKNSKHDESSAARADPTQTTPPSETPGPNRDKNRRKKLRRKQQAEGGVGSFDNSSMGKQSPIRSQEVLWCPAAPRAATSSELADSALSNFDRETKKAWIDAAKGGDLSILKALFSKHPGLTLLRSPGIGHTALHWSCSRGESLLHVTKWLLSPSVNLDPNALNHEGATSLHAAAGVGHVELLHVLASYGVDPCVRCDAGERAGDVAARREHVAFAAACREGEKRSESSSLNGTAASERDEKKSVPVVAAPTRSTPKHDPRDDSDSSDDETSKRAKLAFVSAEAKKKGNAAFAVGDYGKAAKQFTMAIRVDKANNTPNHVLFSNRSGALAGCGRYEDALADAERCIRMAPTWGKGFGRKGAALVGLGQGGEATKAYLAGLVVDPGSEALRAGLAEAKAAIRVAQGRYTEMWGKESSGGVMADEGESAESAPATQTSNGVSATAKKVFSNAPPGNRRDQSDQNDKTLADKYTATDKNPADSTGPDKNGDDKKQIAPETLQATLAVNALDKEVCKKVSNCISQIRGHTICPYKTDTFLFTFKVARRCEARRPGDASKTTRPRQKRFVCLGQRHFFWFHREQRDALEREPRTRGLRSLVAASGFRSGHQEQQRQRPGAFGRGKR